MSCIYVNHLPIDNFERLDSVENLPPTKRNNGLNLNNTTVNFNFDRNDPFNDIALILHGMEMEKYITAFKEENIDLDTFLNLTKEDLNELGVTDPKDISLILKNLKAYQETPQEFVVSENHLDDLKIAKNVHSQLTLLQNYCSYIELQMKKHKLTDYRISAKETASMYLKLFIESALTQVDIMQKRLFVKNQDNNLVRKALKVTGLTLPKVLEEKLVSRGKRKRRRIVLKAAVVLGFVSMIVLIGKCFNKK